MALPWRRPGGGGGSGTSDGTTLYGSGAPANTLGKDGDSYVDTTNHLLYGPKAAGAWPSTGVTFASSTPAYRGAWAALTNYNAGDLVTNPSGRLVSRNADGTSGASYDPTEWTRVDTNNAVTWATGLTLAVGDLVVNAGQTYYTVTAHTTGGAFNAGMFAPLPATAVPAPDVLLTPASWAPTMVATDPAEAGLWQNRSRRIPSPPPKRCMLFTDPAAFTVRVGTSNGTVTADTSDPWVGTQNVLLTATSSIATAMDATFPAPVDFTGCHVRLIFKPPTDFTKIATGTGIILATSLAERVAGNYVHLGGLGGFLKGNENLYGAQRWQAFSVPQSDFTVAGTGVNWASVGYVRFDMTATGGSFAVGLGALEAVPNMSAKAKCCLWFDDAQPVGWTAAAPYMAKYGFPGNLALNIAQVEVDGTALTATQVRKLVRDHGWQVATHAYTNLEHNTPSSDEALLGSFMRSRALQHAAGFSPGGDDFAYYGNFVRSPNNLERVRKTFRSARTFTQQLRFVETLPPADMLNVRAYGTAGGEAASIYTAIIDRTIACKGLAQFVWHGNLTGGDLTAFQTLVDYLNTNRANIDTVTIAQALDSLPA